MKKYDIDQLVNNKSRLVWACRRGMLELDDLLAHFLESGYDELSDTQKRTFVQLLEMPDPDLFALLMGNEQSPDAALQAIVDKIRHAAKSRF